MGKEYLEIVEMAKRRDGTNRSVIIVDGDKGPFLVSEKWVNDNAPEIGGHYIAGDNSYVAEKPVVEKKEKSSKSKTKGSAKK